MIELRGVTVKVSLPQAGSAATSKTLLDSLELRLGESRIAIIGANGSGKSTLLRLCNGLVAPSNGQVLVEGSDSVKDARRVRSMVGFVFTDPLAQLLMGTALDDVELSLRGKIRDRKARRECARKLLEQRGLGSVAEQSVYDLSGGERQLVSLTSVLATDPQIVVADEPTTLLDLRNRDQVCAALWDLPQQLILATHDLELSARAERVIVVDAGQVAADGSPGECLQFYRELMRR